MKVTLAGATLDRRFWVEDEAATPETTSAAYARVSHSPKTLSKLRDEAVEQVSKARASNERIVYRMGHSSIAEHTVFNLDIENASRLLVEFIEHHRLASYTERSQRYVFFGDKEFVIPEEIKNSDLEGPVRELENSKFELYREISDNQVLKKDLGDKLLEQARYVLGLTCPTDIGLTVNARELEYIIGQGMAHPLAEVREFASQALSTAGSLAPSLIKYTEGNGYHYEAKKKIADVLRDICAGPMKRSKHGTSCGALDEGVCSELPSSSFDPEAEIVAGLIFEVSGLPFEDCRCIAREMEDERLMDVLRPVFERYPAHASLPRAFELMDTFFDLDLSASAFAQMKRHRMATILVQDYMNRSWETPEVFLRDPELAARYTEIMKASAKLHSRISKEVSKEAAAYVLTNAHRRRVVFKLNLRELYHFVRLRSDEHAQDEIRSISNKVVKEMKDRYPIITGMLCGKDSFEKGKRILGCSDNTDERSQGGI